MASGRDTIKQRISLDGGKEIQADLKALGEAGEKAFDKIRKAALKADFAKFGDSLNKFGKDLATVGRRFALAFAAWRRRERLRLSRSASWRLTAQRRLMRRARRRRRRVCRSTPTGGWPSLRNSPASPSHEIASLWIAPSPDGNHVGIYFAKRDGTKIRAAVAHDLTEALLGQLMMALEACAERTFAAATPAGEA